MRNILLSLMIIGLTALAVGMSFTGAFFSDMETSGNDTIEAGILDLKVANFSAGQYVEPPGVLVSIADFKPGDVRYSNKKFRVENNPSNVWLKISNMTCVQNGTTKSECIAEGGTWSGECGSGFCTGNTPKDDLNTRINYDLCVDIKGDGSAKDCIAANLDFDDRIIIPLNLGKTLELSNASANGIVSCWIPLAINNIPNTDVGITQSFHLFSNTGDEYQTDRCTFSEEYLVTQINGPAPGPLCSIA